VDGCQNPRKDGAACLLSEPAHETIRAAGDFTEQMAFEMIIRSAQTVQEAVADRAMIRDRLLAKRDLSRRRDN
jgi:hypothetical protein